MIKHFATLFLSLLFQTQNCEEHYIDKILCEKSSNNYYIMVNIKEQDLGVKKMIIPRNDFLYVLGFDSSFIKQYSKVQDIKKLVLKNYVFSISNSTLIKQYFLSLSTPDKRVDTLCFLGKDQFLNAVFNSKGLQKDTTYDIGYTIQKLFELKVPVLFYGESSRLYIDRTFSCKQD